MKSEIDQPFGNIFHGNPGSLANVPEIDNAFVGHAPISSLVKNREIRFELRCHIVGVKNGDLGGVTKSVSAHHRDVRPADRQNSG